MAMSICLYDHLFFCSFVCHLERVLVGHWPAWPSSASGCSAAAPTGPRVSHILVKFIKHNQSYYLKLHVSTSIGGLRLKLVLSSSGSWHGGKTPCQESGHSKQKLIVNFQRDESFHRGCPACVLPREKTSPREIYAGGWGFIVAPIYESHLLCLHMLNVSRRSYCILGQDISSLPLGVASVCPCSLCVHYVH